MDEIQLAGFADRLCCLAEQERISRFVTNSPDVTERDVALVNAELERRGVDLRVVAVESVRVFVDLLADGAPPMSEQAS